MDAKKHSSYDVEATADEGQSVSIEQLQHLVQLLDRSDITELEVKRPETGTRLVLRKARLPEVGEHNGFRAIASAAQEEEEVLVEEETKATIVAPLVGMFHTWAKPKGGSLVAVGDRIKTGQLVGTIQSLNVINEVESTVSGRVVEIFVQDEQAVEYGQPLMLIDRSEEA